MRGAGDLPQPEAIVVGLAGHVRAEDAGDVTFGLEVEHGRGLVVPERRRPTAADGAGEVGRFARADEPHGDATAAVHEEPVERLGERLHAVVVGDERKGGLRLAGGDEHGGRRAVDPGPRADRPGDLGVDVEREPVTRMVERPVALGVDRPQTEPGVLRPRRVRAHEDRSAHHADHLRRHADPRVTLADDLLVDARPLGVGVGAAAHVEPLEHDRAAEVGRARRASARGRRVR